MNKTVARLGACAAVGAVAAAIAAPTARAEDTARQITVAVGWAGVGCVTVTDPDPQTSRTTLAQRRSCSPMQAERVSYVTRPGQFFGLRLDAAGIGLHCDITDAAGRVIAEASGVGTVNCLGEW